MNIELYRTTSRVYLRERSQYSLRKLPSRFGDARSVEKGKRVKENFAIEILLYLRTIFF